MDTEQTEKQYEFEIMGIPGSAKKVHAGNLVEHQSKSARVRGVRPIKLTDRDFEILEFFLEMKFASLDEVCTKFFAGRPGNENVVGYWYAKKRLAHLEQARFLKSTKQFSETRRLYFATPKAYQALRNLYIERDFPRPLKQIDSRTVVHDYLLLKMRMELERRFQVHSWISDRSLKKKTGSLSQLGEVYSPDGIYTPHEGPPVAFELEIALKAKDRYRAKVNRYVEWIHEHRDDPEAFKRVHFVTTNPAVKKHLDNCTDIFTEQFSVEMITAYFAESVGLR